MQNKENLISDILDEIKELELLTKGMQDPSALQDLAIKKTRNLLLQYKSLRELQNTEKGNIKPMEEVELQPEESEETEKTAEEEKPEKAETKKKSRLAKILHIGNNDSTKESEEAKQKVETVETSQTTEAKEEKEEIQVEKEEEKEEESTTNVEQEPQAEQKPNVLKGALNESVLTRNDQFKSQPTSDSKPIKRMENRFSQSLKQSLALNDRIMYSRELFEGKMDKLMSEIDKMDNMGSLSEAMSYIEGLGWNKEKEAVKSFIELLNRRFS